MIRELLNYTLGNKKMSVWIYGIYYVLLCGCREIARIDSQDKKRVEQLINFTKE